MHVYLFSSPTRTLELKGSHALWAAERQLLANTKSTANQRFSATSIRTNEAILMPMHVVPVDTLLGRRNRVLAILALGRMECFIAIHAHRHIGLIVRDVLLAGQWSVALIATEMLDMECGALGGCVLLGEDQLIACLATGNLQDVCQIAATIDLPAMEEIHQIGQ